MIQQKKPRLMRHNTFCLLILLCLLLTGWARAAELPEELENWNPEVGALVREETDLGEGVRRIWEAYAGEFKARIGGGVKAVAVIMAGVVVLGVVECAAPAGKEAMERYVSMAGALWITAAAAGDLNALIGLGQNTVTEISQLSTLLLPVLAAAEAAAGGVTAASVRQVAAVFFSSVLLKIIERLLLPAVYLYIGTAAAGAVLEGDTMERIGELLKKLITWALGALLTLFTTYLTVSGAVAGAVDAQAVRLAKSAVSAAVPVVGGILAEAAESVLAGAGVLRGMLGTFGALAVLACCLLPFMQLGCQYLLYQCAALVASAAGPAKLTKLLAQLGSAFGLVLAMTAAAALLLIISIVSSLTAVAA